ncbi:hypothetical protein VNO78_19084 [Psophocarpus tetragonolobus]|uniref:B box-type domain-containing protein n=1 Tax=Psophocarpus tetragonolobus TaxID=3891 RepID=A0AAN9S783_PSOTE
MSPLYTSSHPIGSDSISSFFILFSNCFSKVNPAASFFRIVASTAFLTTFVNLMMVSDSLLGCQNEKASATLYRPAGMISSYLQPIQPLVYCKADAAYLCLSCDAKVHLANALSGRHLRNLVCNSCGHNLAYVLCLDRKMLFCRDCDKKLHNVSLPHKKRAIRSFMGCPSANDFAALWGYELNEIEKSASQDQFDSVSCVSADLNVIKVSGKPGIQTGVPSMLSRAKLDGESTSQQGQLRVNLSLFHPRAVWKDQTKGGLYANSQQPRRWEPMRPGKHGYHKPPWQKVVRPASVKNRDIEAKKKEFSDEAIQNPIDFIGSLNVVVVEFGRRSEEVKEDEKSLPDKKVVEKIEQNLEVVYSVGINRGGINKIYANGLLGLALQQLVQQNMIHEEPNLVGAEGNVKTMGNIALSLSYTWASSSAKAIR